MQIMRLMSVAQMMVMVLLWANPAASAFDGEGEDIKPLAALIGSWQSNGDAFGRPAESTMVWAPSLGGRFTRLDYAIRFRTENSKTVQGFSGVAYYKYLGDGKLEAFWADSSGDLHPIKAAWDGTALTSHWGRAGLKQGRTRYALQPGGTVMVTDWILTAEGWRQFNENMFARTPRGE